ncbi:MAG: ABC transporter permease [Gammaproteobacteria bacterium]|nr:ABC transporter permease [Gammaproteobacteria bacterium]
MRLEVIRRIAGKELKLFFASPIGYLFLLAFLAVTLFVFFWGEAYFARNIADVRPMFEWMPVLLVFLSAALTMRMWSEERRTGTLEFVATLPVSGWEFVLGKFLACWALLAVALLLTLPLPVTVSLVADLDWGPVWAGYLAALLLGGAYLSIGLFVSARTDSQIVSLILACFVAGAFYLVGSPVLTSLVGGGWAELLRGVGTGARFESITRGVVDVRDLYFYLSLGAVFLTLNVYALEVQRWAGDGARTRHRGWRAGTALVVANLLAANVWLAPLTALRADVTEGDIYSISDATRTYLDQLEEPLLIRGYFSNQTHPLLAPLVPQMRDLLNEYEVAGGGAVRVEIVDPAERPALEEEANSRYGIRPVPFQVADRYQSSLVNSYFDVLVQYGDEYEVLGFRDLIEVKVVGESELDVQLRNPEYDVTRTIKKVLYGYQGGDSIFANLSRPVEFVGYLSADAVLPPALADYRDTLQQVLEDLSAEADGLFSAEILDPQAGDGALAAEIEEAYGFQPMATSLFDLDSFYFYMTLTDGGTTLQVPLPDALSADATRQAIENGLERFASGLLKTVALSAPEAPPPMMGMPQPSAGNTFLQLRDFLAQDFDVVEADLADGRVPDEAALLVVVDPQDFDERQRFAVDQFLMKGGTVVVAAGSYSASLSQQSLTATPRNSGLADWLAHHGVTVGEGMVMDPQNAAFPAPVTRQVGGFSFQEMVMLDYPYFVDVRPPGLNEDHPITAGLPQVTMAWASPLAVDQDAGRQVTTLLESSDGSWLSSDPDVMPRITESGLSGFEPEGERGVRTLGVLVEGRFESSFAGEPSPLLDDAESDTAAGETDIEAATLDDEAPADGTTADRLGVVTSVIDRSPESARLFVFGSSDFLADQVLRVIGSAEGTIYGNSVQLLANVVDYALEDRSLLAIRARGHFNRTLPPLEPTEQAGLETLNYLLALAGVGLVFLWHRRRVRRDREIHRAWLGEVQA